MSKIIKFYAANQNAEETNPPIPGSTHLPQYLRDIPAPSRSQPTFDGVTYVSNVRACTPFLDAVTAGWIQYSWCDIYISMEDGVVRYNFSDRRVPIMQHREMRAEMAQAWHGYLAVEFTWIAQWQPQTPKGYSLLITHPLNRPDLPFLTASGIIDSDVFLLEGTGKVPFYLREGFTGLIPVGTPLFQIIPIQRANWDRKMMPHDASDRPKTVRKLLKYFTGGYRREFWQRKNYR